MNPDWKYLQKFLKTMNFSNINLEKREKKLNKEFEDALINFYKFKRKSRLINDNNMKILGFNTVGIPENKIKINIFTDKGDLIFYSSFKKYLTEFRSNPKILLNLLNQITKTEDKKLISTVITHYFYTDIITNETSNNLINLIEILIKEEIKNEDFSIIDNSCFNKDNIISYIFDELLYIDEVKIYIKHILEEVINKILKREKENFMNNYDFKELFLTLNIGKISKIIKDIEKLSEFDIIDNNNINLNKKSYSSKEFNIKNENIPKNINYKSVLLANKTENEIEKEFSKIENNLFNDKFKIDNKFLKSELRKSEKEFKKFYIKQLNFNQNNNNDLYSNDFFLNYIKSTNKYKKILVLYHKNFLFIQDCIETIMKNLNTANNHVPKIINKIIQCINNEIKKNNPKLSQYEINHFIFNIFIDKLISPILQFPEKNEFLCKEILSNNIHKSLLTLIKILKKISYGDLFSSEIEANYTPLNKKMIEWILKSYEIINNLLNNKDNYYDIYDENNLDLYQNFCLNKNEIRIFLEHFKKIPEILDNNEYEQIYNNLDRLTESLDENNYFLFLNYNYNKERDENLKIEYKKEFIIEPYNIFNINNEDRLKYFEGIKNCIKHVLIASFDLSDKIKNLDFQKLFIMLNTNIQYRQELKKINLINDKIPLSWYSNYIVKNHADIPNEYKENNYIKLYEELLNETKNLEKKIIAKQLILNNDMLNEINSLKKKLEFEKYKLKKNKKIENLIKIKLIFETLQPEVCVMRQKDYLIYLEKLYKFIDQKIPGDEINKNKNLILLNYPEICVHKKIENIGKNYPELKNNFKDHCYDINSFISKILRLSSESKNDILNKEFNLNKGINNTNLNLVLEDYFKNIKNLIDKNSLFKMFYYSKDPEKMQEKKEKLNEKIQNIIMSKISIQINKNVKEQFERVETKLNDKKFSELCVKYNKIKNKLINFLQIDVNYFNEYCVNIVKNYFDKMDNERYCNNIIKIFSKIINTIINMMIFSKNKLDSSIDDFLPVLIFLCIQCKNENMISNICNCSYFMLNKDKNNTMGFNFINLEGCINYINTLDEKINNIK